MAPLEDYSTSSGLTSNASFSTKITGNIVGKGNLMNKRLSLLALLVFVSTFVSAQDISGTWQGTLSQGEQHQRVIVKFEKNADGEWTGKYLSPDSRYHWGAVAR